MSLQSGAQVIIQLERPDRGFDCLFFSGVPIVNPVFIVIACANSPQGRTDIDAIRNQLLRELYHSWIKLKPGVKRMEFG